MEPYTIDGVARREQFSTVSSDSSSDHGSSTDLSKTCQSPTRTNASQPEITYELVGVIVHSGQANAGHYYSFIKDRR